LFHLRAHYAMKQTFRDGTCELVFDPLSFIGRLVALIPAPRFHRLRYAGVLGPGAKLRHPVVPAVPAQSPRAAVQLTWVQAGRSGSGSQVQDDASPATRHPWSMLLKHVFAVDVMVCVTCGGPMRLLSYATTPKAIGRVVSSGTRTTAAADSSPARCGHAAVVGVCLMPIL
jgi:hypothetical protein